MIYRLIAKLLPDDSFADKRAALNGDQFKDRIEAIYAVLSILDTKASALMRLDGVLVAAAFVGIGVNLYNIKSGMFLVLVLSSLLSMILCLCVVSVDWSFLGYTQWKDNKYDFTEEFRNLKKVRLFREKLYQIAWAFAFISSVLFVISILLAVCK